MELWSSAYPSIFNTKGLFSQLRKSHSWAWFPIVLVSEIYDRYHNPSHCMTISSFLLLAFDGDTFAFRIISSTV